MTLVLGIEVATAGDLEEAQRLFEEARVLARKVGDLRYASFALTNLASLAGMRDDLAQAMRLAEEGLAVGRESGDPTIVRGSSILLGWLLSATGQVREARGPALEVLQDTVATGFHWVTAGALELLAVTEAMTGAVERAAVVAGLADRLREETGEPRQVEDERSYRPMIEKMETALGKEPFGRLRAQVRRSHWRKHSTSSPSMPRLRSADPGEVARDLREWTALLEREGELVRSRPRSTRTWKITEIGDRTVKGLFRVHGREP